ncbi:MAG: glycosyltransferase family 39 protein [Janthinobacterium lividum]
MTAKIAEEASAGHVRPNRLTLFCFYTLLVTTAILCLVWCKYRLFWVDELLEYYTDAKPSLQAIIVGQMKAPFSLEPPAFHLILHLLERVLPHPQVTARLPSIFGLLVTECCVFWIAFRLTLSNVAGFAAMLLSFALVTVDYGPEARAYSLITGCLAFALLSWQQAASRSAHRLLSLIGLSCGLGLALLLHFYGIFIAVPLWVGEAARSMQRRKLDRGVLLALSFGTACILLDVPFERALAPFRLHYYDTGETSWNMVPFTYVWFQQHFAVYFAGPALTSEENAALMIVVLFYSLLITRMRKRVATHPIWVEVALATAGLLPFLELIFAQFSKVYVPRYSLPAVVGLAVLTPIVLLEFRLVRTLRVALICLLCFFSVRYAVNQILLSQANKQLKLSQISDNDHIEEALRPLSDKHIYVQDTARFLVDHYYALPDLESRIVGFYSASCELHWLHRDPASRFAKNMVDTAGLPFVTYGNLTDSPDPKLLIIYHDGGEEWIEQQLQNTGIQVTPVAKVLGGDLVRVTFPSEQTCSG